MNGTAPTKARISAWDRAVVAALGGTGFALSYDALQQMAVAIHVRGLLTYLFPLVIDGFIAYGIRALVVLRDAPRVARFYLWLLFGTATAASIWANALHAVRLNAGPPTGGLRLGDTVVAVLSTIAPLALAGAVHLYILIARGAAPDSDRGQVAGQSDRPQGVAVTRADRSGQPEGSTGQVGSEKPVTALTEHGSARSGGQARPSRPVTEDSRRAVTGSQITGQHGAPETAADLPGQRGGIPPVTSDPVGAKPVTDEPGTVSGAGNRDIRSASDRRADPDTERLLRIARSAVRAEDKLTRKVVAQAIRGQQIPLSSDTLTALMAQLREQHGHPVTSTRN
ncbi:DUF2637 domain-containing protein [Streptomyces sp. SID11385]|uniref:DUF2637 domain-containing protein n=1 Tax=Streptomyces sp. SID11385 TaxID=2706031 RepID=UPI0013CB31DF|nr:DUF2637 domain-containing protein [Streptomyces sp. SID11385]